MPASLGWTDDGLLVLAGMPGRTLRAVLGDPEAPAPDVEEILGLLDSLPRELGHGSRRRTSGSTTRPACSAISGCSHSCSPPGPG